MPFWVDYHYRLIKRDRGRGLIIAGWLVLAAAIGLVLAPQVMHRLELEGLACAVDGRVAAAEEARRSPPPDVEHIAAQLVFSSGAGIEAVTDRCMTAGVTVVGYRPFKPDGDGSATGALELVLEGPYPGLKAVLLWLENGPTQAEIRHLEAAAGDGKVSATILAVQQAATTPRADGERPVFERRADVFLDLGAGEPELWEEDIACETNNVKEAHGDTPGEASPAVGENDDSACREVTRNSGIDRGIGLDFEGTDV